MSGDKDLMQLVDENVTMIDTMKDKTYDAAAVKENFGVGPDKVVEILGLMGDTSDNIPGVPGIGPKTAQRLIEEYGSVEKVLQNAENLKNVKLRESFRQYAEQARLSRQLASLEKISKLILIFRMRQSKSRTKKFSPNFSVNLNSPLFCRK